MLVALLLLSFGCLVTVNVLWIFLTVPWVILQFDIVVYPDLTHLPYIQINKECFSTYARPLTVKTSDTSCN